MQRHLVEQPVASIFPIIKNGIWMGTEGAQSIKERGKRNKDFLV